MLATSGAGHDGPVQTVTRLLRGHRVRTYSDDGGDATRPSPRAPCLCRVDIADVTGVAKWKAVKGAPFVFSSTFGTSPDSHAHW